MPSSTAFRPRQPLPLAAAAPLLLALAAALPAGSTSADAPSPPAVKPPVVGFGLPTRDGPPLWRHGGAHRPADGGGATWTLERAGARTFRGRPVEVLRYVARDAEGNPVERTTWDQADFVDPSTGEIVGGLDGWGQERYAPEGDEPRPCPGR